MIVFSQRHLSTNSGCQIDAQIVACQNVYLQLLLVVGGRAELGQADIFLCHLSTNSGCHNRRPD